MPFLYEGGIVGFIEKEVRPYTPYAYVDEKKITIGYELSFTKYFYKPVQLRSLQEIVDDLREVEAETQGMMEDIIGEVWE